MPESSSDSNNELPHGEPFSDKKIGKSKPQKSGSLKIAGTLSMVLWIVGFVLPFALTKDSPYVWVSDTFLLIGFWPLLFYNKAGWTWVVFGVLNIVAGFGLELVQHLVPNIPESFWTPEKLAYKPWFMNMHHHITDMHPCLPWIIIGALSTVYGIFRITKTIIKFIIKQTKKGTSDN